ncbi:hypothetical protein JCM5353_008344 [Sporobolomyces roseus]
MERNNDYHYPHRPPYPSAPADAFTQRYGPYPPTLSTSTDAFIRQYGNLQSERCPPPPPEDHTSQNYGQPRSLPRIQPFPQNFNPSSSFLPSNPIPPAPTYHQQLHYPDLTPCVFESGFLPQTYATSSHQNNQSFPFHHPPSSSIQSRSTLHLHPLHSRGGYYYLDDETGNNEVNEEKEEEGGPASHNRPRQEKRPSAPFLPSPRDHSQHARLEGSQSSPDGMMLGNELANLRRATRHAREHPIQPDLANPIHLEEIDARRNAEARDALNWNRKKDGSWNCYDPSQRSRDAWLKRQPMSRHGRR